MSNNDKQGNLEGDRSAGGQREAREVLDHIISREVGRLRMRGRRLLAMLDKRLQRYPSAQRLVADVDAVVRAHRAFAESLGAIDWSHELTTAGAQLDRLVLDVGAKGSLDLRWDGEYGLFCIDVEGPVWRVREKGACIDVAALVESAVDITDVAGQHGEGVTYPIIFTHEVEANHLAVSRAVGWALVVACAIDRLGAPDWPDTVGIRRGHQSLQLTTESESPASSVPPADDFGFADRGELFRRLDEFNQTDPAAHWIHWMNKRRRAPCELRVLREQGGARRRIEIRRSIRRLRIVEQPRSEIVRKRRHVFVDESSARAEDRYFSSESALDEAAEEQLRQCIDDGFRIVYERLEMADGVRERGRRSRST